MNADFSFYLRKSASSAEEQRLSKPGVFVAKIRTLFSAGAEVTTCRDGREHGGRHKDTKNKLKAGTGNIERRTLNFEHPMRAKHGTGVFPQISRMNADFLFFIGVIRVICGKTRSFKTPCPGVSVAKNAGRGIIQPPRHQGTKKSVQFNPWRLCVLVVNWKGLRKSQIQYRKF
jgi:hypothetical protein